MSLRVGLDLVLTDAIRDSIRDHGDRYLHRIYTADELRDCDFQPDRLAARFAAKEATMKALGREDEAVPWRSIEVRRCPSGRPEVVLTGEAAALADRLQIDEVTMSMTHDGSMAAAVVVAQVSA
ncbi:MAG: holo-ACP synthase [Solirubrobacteraceae bacterium]